MPSQTIVVSIVAAAAVIALLYWRSKKEEKTAREADKKIRRDTSDVLMGSARRKNEGDSAEDFVDEDEPAATEPSFEPPVYAVLEKEEKAAEEAEKVRREEEEIRRSVRAVPLVDGSLEWILDIYPREGNHFSLGGVQSLNTELQNLRLPLPIKVWAKSSKDKLYYEADELACPASHVVATIVLANRSAVLDDVVASRFYQALEQSAAQNDVPVRRNIEPKDAVALAQKLSKVIRYFDAHCELIIEPRDPNVEFTLERISSFARSLGFTQESGRWDYRAAESDPEPIFSLQYSSNGTRSLSLRADIPLLVPSRGDVRRFFMLANHIADSLHGVWCNYKGEPLSTAGAFIIEDMLMQKLERMSKSSIEAGSRRAVTLFGRTRHDGDAK